jgi:hypothetical protein
VDLQERLQLDAARHSVAKVKARTRPWRYILAILLAVVAATVSVQARYVYSELGDNPNAQSLLTPLGRSGNLALSYGTAVAFCLLAGAGTLGLGNKAREVLERSVGTAHAAVVRFAVIVVGGLATVVFTLELLNIQVTQLVVGGALTGVLVGIAAQQSLANVFAGIVLLMARPFRVGDQIGIRSGALGGLLEGTVSEVSITYVRLETATGPVHIPNSQVLAAAVGPAGALPPPAGSAAPAPATGTPPPGPGSDPAEPGSAAQPAIAEASAAGAETTGPPAGASAEHATPEKETPPGTSAPVDPPGAGEPAQPESPGSEPERDTGH